METFQWRPCCPCKTVDTRLGVVLCSLITTAFRTYWVGIIVQSTSNRIPQLMFCIASQE